MPVSYETENMVGSISPVIEGYVEWFGRLIRRAFYPAHTELPLPFPQEFELWASKEQILQIVDRGTLEKLRLLKAALEKSAMALINSETQPPVEVFDEFLNLYDDFILNLRRVESDCMLSDSGIDIVTGVRSRTAMNKDLEREMERFTRRGKPFCLVFARLDGYEEFLSSNGREKADRALKVASGLLLECARVYDDVYRPNGPEFVVVLKHADITGGKAFVERFKKMIDDGILSQHHRVMDGKLPAFSFCLSEPAPGEDLEATLSDIRKEVEKVTKDSDQKDITLQHEEVSALHRFLQKQGE